MGNQDDMVYYFQRIGVFIQDAYVSIHHKYVPDPNKKPNYPGDACQDINTLVRQAMFWGHQKETDIYLAMGAQESHAGFKDKARLPTALRKMHNIIACKCFYIDVDVDDDPKKECYRTVEEMDAAIAAFVAGAGLPSPNLVVNSGRGGKHLYWALGQAIHPLDFAPVARGLANAIIALGLKADAQCTTDVCRLLRVPRTFNFKTGKPFL